MGLRRAKTVEKLIFMGSPTPPVGMGLRLWKFPDGVYAVFTHPAGGDGIETYHHGPTPAQYMFTHPAGGDGIETKDMEMLPSRFGRAFTHPAGGDGIETN